MFADAAAPPLAPGPLALAPSFDEIKATLAIWLALAVAVGFLCLLLRLLPAARGPLFPPQRQRAVPWTIMQLLLVAVAYQGWLFLAFQLFRLENPKTLPIAVRMDRTVLAIWAVFPLQLLTILAILWRAADMQLYQIGLSFHRWAKDFQAAWFCWLVWAPATFGVFWGARWLSDQMGQPVELSLPEQWLTAVPSETSAALSFLAVVVAAPILEELLFRGVLQPWFITTPRAADVVMLAAIIIALVRGVAMDSYWPLLFLFLVSPGYLAFERLTWNWLRRPESARGIYATSLLFAAVHFDVWPGQIPLFVLSLGLGMLAFRTQSIIGPIVMHALFNAISGLDFLRRMAAP